MGWRKSLVKPSKEKRTRWKTKRVINEVKKSGEVIIMSTQNYTPRLAEKYKKEVVPALMKKFGYTSVMQATEAGKNLFEPWNQRMQYQIKNWLILLLKN